MRADGWGALQRAYGLPFTPGSGLDHGLAYQALARGQVDVVDAYTTDAQIARLRLRVLRDDREFFPRYDAVLLMRATVDERPLARRWPDRIDDVAMRAMNGEVEIDGKSFEAVAREFLARSKAAGVARPAAAATSPAAAASWTACSRRTCRACCASTSCWCSPRWRSRWPSACRWACWRTGSRACPAA